MAVKSKAKKAGDAPKMHTKEQFLASKKYRKCRDVLAVVLAGGRLYSTEEVDDMLDAFLKRPIVEKRN